MPDTSSPRTWNPFRRVIAWIRRRQELLRLDILLSVQRQPNCSPGVVWSEVSRSRWNLSLTLVGLMLDQLEAEGLVVAKAIPALSRPGETRKAYSLTDVGATYLASVRSPESAS